MEVTYDPWRHARELALTVETLRLPPRRRGQYLHSERRILIAERLTRLEARCTLAHELGHAVSGDQPALFGPLHARQERRARRTAASWLIDQAEYERAAAMFEGEPRLIANELDVTLEVLEDYVALVLGTAA